MAITIPVGNAIRDIILDITKDYTASGFQKFGDRIGDLSTLRGFFATTPQFNADIASANMLSRSTFAQDIAIDYFKREPPGTGTTRKRTGTGGSSIERIIFPLNTPIEEEFSISYTNLSRIEGTPEHAKYMTVLRREFEQRVINIMVRANAQYVLALEANKWLLNTVGDAGTQYTTFLADAKQVPVADLTDGLNLVKTKTELRDNNMNYMGAGNPLIFSSTAFEQNQMIYRQQGQFNDKNLTNVMDWYTPYIDNNISNGAADQVYYVVAPGSVGAFNWTMNFGATNPNKVVNGELVMAEDAWSVITAPIMFPEQEQFNFNIEIKYRQTSVDNSGTEGVGAEADPVESFVMTTTFGTMVAPDHADITNIKPIVKYEVS